MTKMKENQYMTLQEKFEEYRNNNEKLLEYIRSCELDISSDETSTILRLVNLENYLQIVYNYGESLIRCLMNYNISRENYKACAKIQETVKKHNQATGANIKLTK